MSDGISYNLISIQCGGHLRKANFKNAGPPRQNLGAFRGITELILKVYLRIGLKSAIRVSNSCDLAWIELKSKHFRLKV